MRAPPACCPAGASLAKTKGSLPATPRVTLHPTHGALTTPTPPHPTFLPHTPLQIIQDVAATGYFVHAWPQLRALLQQRAA